MKYLSGVHSDTIQSHFQYEADFGLMAQPASGTVDKTWLYNCHAFDNGAFGAFKQGKPFNPAPWRRKLQLVEPDGLLFVTVPDVVGDHEATRQAWDTYAPEVDLRGLPKAFVLQNGCVDLAQVPRDAQAVFIGGDDAYKLGRDAAHVTWQAQRAGLWVHMGRVNSTKRWLRALAMGCDSADGTYLRFGPQAEMCAKVAGWLATGRQRGAQLSFMDVA